MKLELKDTKVTKNELEELDRTNPYNVVGGFIQTITEYKAKDFYEKIEVLVGDKLTEIMRQNIKDRMLQNTKFDYIGKSYFVGATPTNDYEPTSPYELEIEENKGIDKEENFKYLLLKSGGAASPRGITLRLAKDGNYYIWSDSFMGLLADIREPESTNKWA